ncbi:hypothetical protein SAMN05444157_3085 [Frankineae bacterium MT45]|nr:hypothetical protein SAMN05444157_3085 [Frankineae bacterium MT45]
MQAMLDGLGEIARSVPLPGGVLVIEAGGYDEIDSSPLAFGRAAEALGWTVASLSAATDDDGLSLMEVIAKW